ncbi:MAG: hypothetical protein EHM23_28140 [Acidobacteria bacterium]|nr:MAG: hypothetical protein EHM23_28140 [Acidobacteriota bacterium]
MRTLLILSLLLVMAGCIPTLTLQPLWDKEHAVSETAFEGRWISAEGDSTLRVTNRVKDAKYSLDFASEDGVSHYEGHLIRLQNYLILDLSLEEDAAEKLIDGQAFAPVLPVHFFARVRIEGDKLSIGLLPEDDMEKQIEAGMVKVQRSKTPAGVILTGDTAELQAIVSKLAGDGEVWEESLFYRTSSVLPSTDEN